MQQHHTATAWTTPIGHSTEIEHRLTKLEVFVEGQREANVKADKRFTLLERGLLVLLISVTAVAHERIPWLTKAIVGLVKTAPM